MQTSLIALIPAYEPDEILVSLVKEADDAGYIVIVVNDGSSRDKDRIFEEVAPYATVLCHDENKGKGRALKTGFTYIQENFSDDSIVVTLDADGQHRLEDAGKICRAAMEHRHSLILGSRALDENVPARSKLGNTITRFVFRIATGQKVNDTQTGLRAFSAGMIPLMLDIPGERYEYEMNMLLQCSRKGIPIREVEISTIYLDGNSSSHFNTFKDSFLIYKEILKFSASSFTSFLIDYGMYTILTILTLGMGMGSGQSILISNIGARVVSASANYTMNRKLVFKSNAGIFSSAGKYALLAAAILAGNTLVLGFLSDYVGINRFAAKIITELLFFMISWLVQRRFIFNEKDGSAAIEKKQLIAQRKGVTN